jgi:Holliday junction resolvasome RuvABC endonuclease subunit
MKLAGLDLSMTETGAAWTADPAAPGECWAETSVIRPRLVRDRRLPEIRRRVLEVVKGADFVLIEKLPPHLKSAGITGMVHGVIRDALLEAGIPYGDIGPSSLKLFATGRGGASKTEMALAALKRGGLEFRNDNQCDAWWLWVAANEYRGCPVIELPKRQREALADKIMVEGE